MNKISMAQFDWKDSVPIKERKKPFPKRCELAKELCNIMGWKDTWNVWNCPLTIEKYRDLIIKLKQKEK